ncbi:MAG: exodeoxyribonuclease VII large subunit [Steroidobacteraceae bacterium]|nr:exodeoxyribonuclease VII large subunit [Steroidobacteraceae bacterium]
MPYLSTPIEACVSERPPVTGLRASRDVYTVSRLNREVRMLLDHGMPVVWVEAEVSNFSRPASGHWYFTLKDRDAQVRCAMFRQRNMAVRFVPAEGKQVLARARVGLYEPRGDYQLIVDHLEEAGVGALKREFERLKEKLAAEGLFATELKRPLPAVPRRIGVVTSPSGAAVRDVVHVLGRRFPAADVLVYPTAVQGAAAVPEILAALALAAGRAEVDVLIVARGGGSLEDLQAFNDERVARAIRASPVPVITGIGHEVDFTIADFVADVRAPTPSGAAELAVPDRREWLLRIGRIAQRLDAAALRRMRSEAERLQRLRHRLARLHPGTRLQQRAQRLDELEQRLVAMLRLRLAGEGARLQDLAARLAARSPALRLRDLRLREQRLSMRLDAAIEQRLGRLAQRLALARRGLHAVSPLATLGRGFALATRAADGALLRAAGDVQVGAAIRVRLGQGALDATVTGRRATEDEG